jgi:hypothetical protein
MSMSADLRDRLKPIAGGQVYRDEIPQTIAGKRIRLQVAADSRPVTHDGDQAMRETTVQVDCMSSSRGDTDDLVEAALATACPPALFGATAFSRSFVDQSRSYSERADTGVVTYVTSLDLRVWHEPAA